MGPLYNIYSDTSRSVYSAETGILGCNLGSKNNRLVCVITGIQLTALFFRFAISCVTTWQHYHSKIPNAPQFSVQISLTPVQGSFATRDMALAP